MRVLALLFFLAGCADALQEAEPTADPDPATGYVFDENAPPDDPTPDADPAPEAPPSAAEPSVIEAAQPLDLGETGSDSAPAEATSSAAEDDPPRVDPNRDARRRCTRRGGAFTKTAAGLFICARQTRDANRPCDAAQDCQGACLARSRTCAPFTPLLGCHEVITSGGSVSTVCVE